MPSVSYPLENGGFALVDQADVPLLDGRIWRRVKCSGKEYVYAENTGGKPARIYMHRYLMGVHEQSRPLIDHKNGDGLDNRRSSNLRVASYGLNTHNRQTVKGKYRGVFAQSGGYMARIAGVYGGLFATPSAAAIAADAVATQVYGDDASLNYPSDLGSPWLNARFLCSK